MTRSWGITEEGWLNIHFEISGVLRSSTLLFEAIEDGERRLAELAEASAALYYMANYERREAVFHHKSIPSYGDE